jgi:Ala-tRNA(Pro) deacylase
MVKIDGKMAMAALPAPSRIEMDFLKRAAGAQSIELATEADFKNLFPDCETGAMPPVGNLYGMSVFADTALSKDDEIAFNAGSHRELIRMAYKDFERLVQPAVADFSVRP